MHVVSVGECVAEPLEHDHSHAAAEGAPCASASNALHLPSGEAMPPSW